MKKSKGIKKYQYKERAIIRLINLFIKESIFNLKKIQGIDLLKLNPVKMGEEDLKILSLHKKIDKLSKMYFTPKIENFISKRLSHISLDPRIQPFTLALVLLYFYQKSDIKKDFIIDFKSNEIEELINYVSNVKKIDSISFKYGVDIFISLYPDKAGYIEFLKHLNKFPFNYLNEKNGD
jgi:hypothetical protein